MCNLCNGFKSLFVSDGVSWKEKDFKKRNYFFSNSSLCFINFEVIYTVFFMYAFRSHDDDAVIFQAQFF